MAGTKPGSAVKNGPKQQQQNAKEGSKQKAKMNAQKAPAGGSGGKKMRKEARADLVFPVGRIHRQMVKGRYAPRVASGAALSMAAVLEYLTAEILELACNVAKEEKKMRLNPRHLQFAIHNDEELSKLFCHTHITGGGVRPSAIVHVGRRGKNQKTGNASVA